VWDGDYRSEGVDVGGIDLTADLQKFMLVFARIASVLWLIPFFSSRAVVTPYKAGLTLLISFLLYDSVAVSQTLTGDPYQLLLLTLKEVFVGLVIGFFVRILFMVVYVAGDIASLQSGLAFARFMDPFTMTQSTPLEQFQDILAIMVFLAIDAHHILLQGLAESFKGLPIGSVVIKAPLFTYLTDSAGKVFSLGLKIGAPVIVTLMLVDLALGMLSRMIPQVNIFVEGVPVKILVTVTMLSFSLGVIVPGVASLFRGMDAEILKIFRLMV
jgi:flagellar biosynthesis protein FliR